MSWDLFVEDLPAGITSIAEIPSDFRPSPLGARTELIQRILQVVPDADFSDPSWGHLQGAGFSIEFGMGEREACSRIGLHVRGDHSHAICVIERVLEELGPRALDDNSDTGLFQAGEDGRASFDKWRRFRDRVSDDFGT